jgi:glycerol-3-phosphate acyltransferase PlsY
VATIAGLLAFGAAAVVLVGLIIWLTILRNKQRA